MQAEPEITFTVHAHDTPGLELRVNFGVFAGRAATPAELDRLAELLLDEVGEVSIISEDRHETDGQVEASVHQVRVEIAREAVPTEPSARAELEEKLVNRADDWARMCIADRHADVAEI
jgi:hypothetical protein